MASSVPSSGTVAPAIASGSTASDQRGAPFRSITATRNGPASAQAQHDDKKLARTNTCSGPRQPGIGACRHSISSGASNSCRCASDRPSHVATSGHAIRP